MNVLQIKLKLGDDTPAHWFDVDSIDFFNDRVCFVDGVGESVDIEYQCEPLRFAPPSLTDNQQEVLEWLKREHFDSYIKSVLSNLYFYVNMTAIGDLENKEIQEMVNAYEKLSQEDFAQVLQVFASWALEQEETK